MGAVRLLLVLGWMAALGVLAGPVDRDLPAAAYEFPPRAFEGANTDRAGRIDWRIVMRRHGPGEAVYAFEAVVDGDPATGSLVPVSSADPGDSVHGGFGLSGMLRSDGRARPLQVRIVPARPGVPCRDDSGRDHPLAVRVTLGRSDPLGLDDGGTLHGCGRFLRD